MRCAAVIAAILVASAWAVGQATGSGPVEDEQISVAANAQPIGGFLGLGVEFDPYEKAPDPTRWNTMMDRLAWMRPGFLRVMSGASDYCSGLDSNGNPIYRWKTDPNAPELQRLYSVLDFAQQHGVQVYLGEWSPPGNLGIHSPGDPRWARMIAGFVDYLVREKHYTVVNHYIMMNEPNGQWMWHHGPPDFAAWSTGVRQLRKELDSRGLQQIILTGPDNSGDRAWFDRSVRELHSYFGAWEQHIYASDEEVSSGAIERGLIEDGKTILQDDPNGALKPRFIAESGLRTGKNNELDQQPRVHDFDYGVRMADYVAQVARAGWMGADAWDLDDAMHGNGHGGLKIWGFWDSSTAEGMKPRPWFYSWALLSRYLPSGAQIVRVDESGKGTVKAVAARWLSKRGLEWTIVLVNDSDSAAVVDVKLPEVSNLATYRYFDHEQLADTKGFPQPVKMQQHPDRKQVISLPSMGMVVLTTASGDEFPAPEAGRGHKTNAGE